MASLIIDGLAVGRVALGSAPNARRVQKSVFLAFLAGARVKVGYARSGKEVVEERVVIQGRDGRYYLRAR